MHSSYRSTFRTIGDVTPGEPHDGCPLFQGRVPEMKDVLSKIGSAATAS